MSARFSAAQQAAVLRTIPNKHVQISVTTSAVKHDLSNVGGVDLRGKWVWLRPKADITVLRGDHDGAPNAAITVDTGLPLQGGKAEEFWVDRTGDMTDGKGNSVEDSALTVIGAAATTLEILYSDV